jgi:hypothetical protein
MAAAIPLQKQCDIERLSPAPSVSDAATAPSCALAATREDSTTGKSSKLLHPRNCKKHLIT